MTAAHEARRARRTLAGAYAGLYLPLGVFLPYFPLWLAACGLSPEEIGVAIAVPQLTRLAATPILGVLSDRLGQPKAMLLALALATVGLVAILLECRAPLAIILVSGLAAMVWNPCFALLDAYASRQARAGRVDYGRSRLWGSGAFIVANLVGGYVVQEAGAQSVVPLMLMGNLAFLAAVFVLPELPRAAPQPKGMKHGRARTALVVGILAAAAVQASHGMLYAFVSVHWSTVGFGSFTIGALWAVGVVAEIGVFRLGTRLTRRLGPAALIAVGGLAAVLRYAVLAGDPPLPVLVGVQMLHGLTFGATYLGTVELVARSVSEDRAAGMQSLAAWTVSLALSAASIASGPLWATYGAPAFLFSAVLGAVGTLLALASGRLHPHSSGAAGNTVAPS